MKILLVDDAKSVQMVMTARLVSYGHDVLHAGNGQEALTLFASAAPDLVLMDLEMPVMNGFEATSRIRAFESTQQWAWTPIIFLTSSDTVENLVTAIEAGGDDFMSKFVPEPVLQAKMKAMSRIAALRQSLSAANRKLQDLASLDGLTGLCNRRSMDLRTDQLWDQAQTLRESFGLLMIDIDNFKKFNDHYGHQAGDDCLRQVAQTIDTAVRQANEQGHTQDAFAARYGGEEFAVLVPGAQDTALQQLAQNIVSDVQALGLAHTLNAQWGVVTISVGGAVTSAAQGAVVDLFRQADARLYLAKEGGRNRAVLAG
ncbi:MAG: diguanylate cyclase response regulator [Comamonadaceae bacterium CG1_02_60_18]|nr:MAG: diguanylate cyclase response regulator [Comamonadaceae bacterium CG1_02_60_18]PIQ51482.1 MAG: diguanylate cyclase response regulator [Comamonadaceae bacterium CG12_big_fil_rev_8_21_14_0_65_59_15]